MMPRTSREAEPTPRSVRSGFEERPDYFSSVAFWYQEGVNQGLPEPAYADERLPLGNAQQIAVEDSVKEVTTENGNVTCKRADATPTLGDVRVGTESSWRA